MRKIKEIFRLWLLSCLTQREIARATKTGRATVAEYIQKAADLGLTWPQIESISEAELDGMLFPPSPHPETAAVGKPLPEWAEVDEDLRKHRELTLLRVWEEYRQDHPDGYGYSQFHFHFRKWKKKQGLVMRQLHRAGEKLFIDYCDGIKIIGQDGDPIKTQLFVAVWGASNYTFAQASLSQDLPSWIQSHVTALEYFGCVPHVLTPDNLKSGVSRACLYEPDLNPTYQDFAIYYGAAVVPARPYKARDKAKVEKGVQVAQRWILAALRKRTFYSLAELNAAIAELLRRLNDRIMRQVGKSRRELFESLDRPAALPLPPSPYEFATWRKQTLGLDYHVFADYHHYSVPYQLVGQEVHIRLSANSVEVLFKGERVASHIRSRERGGSTTLTEHMPPAHKFFAGINIDTARSWAESAGPSTIKLFEKIWQKHNGAPSALNAFRGIYHLASTFGKTRVEQAATRAVRFGSCTYTSMKRILSGNLDQNENNNGSRRTLPVHENVRGSQYYSEEDSIC